MKKTAKELRENAIAQVNKGLIGSLAGEDANNDIYLIELRLRLYDWIDKIEERLILIDSTHP